MLKVLALLGLFSYSRAAFPKSDLVKSLPQMSDLSFGLYSGYVPINDTSKQLHYVAALSKGDWSVDPVIVWFNGGPGCSSLLGWAQEHGPYVMEDGTTSFVSNYYTWNNEATVIYLESPADVGFSYCPEEDECIWNDDNTASDNLIALLNLFTMKFKDLQSNDLYIAGESYAGIYVPKLAQQVDWYIGNNTDAAYLPNLKGFIVGNGVTDWKYDTTPAFFETAYWFGLIDDQLYDNVKANCDLSYYRWNASSLSDQCQTWMDDFNSKTNQVNVYDLLGKCYYTSQFYNAHRHHYESQDALSSPKFLAERELFRTTEDQSPAVFTASMYTPFLYTKEQRNAKKLKSIPECVYGQPVLTYLNTDTVRSALHILDAVGDWDLCNDDIDYTSSAEGSIDIYRSFKDKNYKILKYSGDTDGSVPTSGTRQWINELNWDIKKQWHSFTLDGQVGGYAETRNNGKFTFATIHGAGHMAPQWKRQATYYAVFNFIRDDPI